MYIQVIIFIKEKKNQFENNDPVEFWWKWYFGE